MKIKVEVEIDDSTLNWARRDYNEDDLFLDIYETLFNNLSEWGCYQNVPESILRKYKNSDLIQINNITDNKLKLFSDTLSKEIVINKPLALI